MSYKEARVCECGYTTLNSSNWCTHNKRCKLVTTGDKEWIQDKEHWLIHSFATLAVHIKYVFILLEYVLRGDIQPNLIIPRSALRDHVHSVSISQGGFNMAYTAGVIHVVRQHAEVFQDAVFLGVSTGAVVASCICVGMSSKDVTNIMKDFNGGFIKLGPKEWHKLIRRLGVILEDMLPENAHEMCNGRLVVGITSLRVGCPSYLTLALALFAALVGLLISGMSNTEFAIGATYRNSISATLMFLAIVGLMCGTVHKTATYRSQFANKADLINVLQCSCSIPLVQDGIRLRGGQDATWFIDGGFTMHHVLVDHAEGDTRTITVDQDRTHTPRADVVPPVMLPSRVVTPPNTEIMYELFHKGANDFHEHISCVLGIVPPREI